MVTSQHFEVATSVICHLLVCLLLVLILHIWLENVYSLPQMVILKKLDLLNR